MSSDDKRLRVFPMDCLDFLAMCGDGVFDAVVTDPPYGLEFMGKEWDGPKAWSRGYRAVGAIPQSGRRPISDQPGAHDEGYRNMRGKEALYQAWCERWATECLRVLKPGGHLLAFGGTRTYHRLACAIEDAGFEIRDSLHWFYGSGFPKSLDVSKAIDKAAGAEREVVGRYQPPNGLTWNLSEDKSVPGDGGTMGKFGRRSEALGITAPATPDATRWEGWGTALKPAHEPIVLARKPLAGTVAENVLEHGTGALNIDGCRVEGVKPHREVVQAQDNAWLGGGPWKSSGVGSGTSSEGRWPTNILLTHSADCNGNCVPDCPVAALDRQSGSLTSGKPATRQISGSNRLGNTSTAYGAESRPAGSVMVGYGDTGGASRFFPQFAWDAVTDIPFLYQAKAPAKERPKVEGISAHPTVKPLALMRWLVRLVTQPDGCVLDLFAGTGTTGQACLNEGLRCVLVENNPDYVKLIRERLDSYEGWSVRGDGQ